MKPEHAIAAFNYHIHQRRTQLGLPTLTLSMDSTLKEWLLAFQHYNPTVCLAKDGFFFHHHDIIKTQTILSIVSGYFCRTFNIQPQNLRAFLSSHARGLLQTPDFLAPQINPELLYLLCLRHKEHPERIQWETKHLFSPTFNLEHIGWILHFLFDVPRPETVTALTDTLETIIQSQDPRAAFLERLIHIPLPYAFLEKNLFHTTENLFLRAPCDTTSDLIAHRITQEMEKDSSCRHQRNAIYFILREQMDAYFVHDATTQYHIGEMFKEGLLKQEWVRSYFQECPLKNVALTLLTDDIKQCIQWRDTYTAHTELSPDMTLGTLIAIDTRPPYDLSLYP